MMIFIFYMSSDSNSGQKSDFITLIVLKILNFFFFLPSNIINTDFIGFIIRKIAHISEYFILNLLFYIGFYKNCQKISKNKLLLLSIVFSIIYSITDEIHQTFVPNRVGSYKDVIIDSMGCLIFYLFGKIRIKSKDTM